MQTITRLETSESHGSEELPITFDSATRWLRAQGVEDDRTILEALQGAVQEAERRTHRTLRKTITRTVYFDCWKYEIPLPHPPLASVTSVKYYDSANVLQTISSADYEVKTPTHAHGTVQFDWGYNLPVLYPDRRDRVQIVYVSGYAGTTCPPAIKTAVRMLVIAAYDGDEKTKIDAHQRLQPWVWRG